MPKDAIENFYLNTRGTTARVAQSVEAVADTPVATYVNHLLLVPPEQKVPRSEAKAAPSAQAPYNARIPAAAPVATYVHHLLLAPPEQKVPRPEAEAEAEPVQASYADSPYRWTNFK